MSARPGPPEPRRVLLLSERADFFGGGQRSLVDLARHLRGSPFAPIVLAPGPGPLPEQLRADGVETHLLALPPPGVARLMPAFGALATLAALVRRRGIVILHSDSPRTALYAGLAARATRRAHLWHLRASVTRSPGADRALLALTDGVVAVSRAAAMRSAPVAHFARKTVVPTGIPFAEPLDQRAARRRLELPDDRFVLGVVGRVEPDKGGDDAIAALVAARVARPDALLAFLGAVDERDPWPVALRRQAETAGLAGAVRFLGARPEAAPLLRAFDLLLHPSRHEALPRVVIEALAAGVPPIAYAVGGVPEVIEDGRTGVLVAPRDARAFASAAAALTASPPRRARLASAGPPRARERFSVETMVTAVLRIYGGLVGAPPAVEREAA